MGNVQPDGGSVGELRLKLPRFGGHPARFCERCRHAENPSTVFTRVSSPDGRSWCVPAAIHLTWRGSSSLLRRRSATGSSRPIVRMAEEQRSLLRPRRQLRLRSARNWPGYGARTSSCGWSATFSLERRPGSRARAAPCRPDLPVHEREPGQVSRQRHGARARRVEGRLLCLAEATCLEPCTS